MKKMILFGIAVVFSMNIAAAQTDTDVLPQNAQNFIDEHFSSKNIEKADEEKGMLDLDQNEAYEVHLSNDMRIDFNQDGNPTEIESLNDVQIPESALPENILSYVQSNYSDSYVVSWETDDNGQEIQLSNGIDLEFDPNGNFQRED